MDHTIFVSIASYRDIDCPNTLQDLFLTAKYPDRIFIGICQQNNDNDVECVFLKRIDQIRVFKMTASQAKGPCLARFLCSQLFQGEMYYLQIDSHTRFSPEWDVKFITMYTQLEKIVSKPIISYYPNEYHNSNETNTTIGRICSVIWDKQINMLTFPGATLLPPTKQPLLGIAVTGCCFFARSDFLKDVSFDPLLPNLFTGEEILFTARLWTSGWDVFSPNENLLFHEYDRNDKPKFWDTWGNERSDGDVLKK